MFALESNKMHTSMKKKTKRSTSVRSWVFSHVHHIFQVNIYLENKMKEDKFFNNFSMTLYFSMKAFSKRKNISAEYKMNTFHVFFFFFKENSVVNLGQ